MQLVACTWGVGTGKGGRTRRHGRNVLTGRMQTPVRAGKCAESIAHEAEDGIQQEAVCAKEGRQLPMCRWQRAARPKDADEGRVGGEGACEYNLRLLRPTLRPEGGESPGRQHEH